MRKSGTGSGGGLGSRVVKSGPGARKVEPRAQGIRPGHVGQTGMALGDHATDAGGRKLHPAVSAKTPGYNPPVGANINSKPTVYGNSGTQAQHGRPEGTAPQQGRDILSEFGSESPNVRGRR